MEAIDGYGYIVVLGDTEDVADWCDDLLELGYMDYHFTGDADLLATDLGIANGWDVVCLDIDGSWKVLSDGDVIPFLEGVHEKLLFFRTEGDDVADEAVAEMLAEMQRLDGQSASYDLRHYYEFEEI